MSNNFGWQLTIDPSVDKSFIAEGTEIFKSGKWAFLARELIQNSNDALAEGQKKLIMTMELNDININEFPDRENLLKHINGTLNINDVPERCEKFCKNAKNILEDDIIRVLKVSDYNTKGVVGSEKSNNEIKSPWNALVYDEGNSQKESENSTGSFGTGKNAPFALSGINTVFYVTKDINEKYAVEGVAKLFTSFIDGKKRNRKVYFAKLGDNNEYRPLDYNETKNNLSKLFHREEIGSDVLIFGVNFDKEQIKKEIIQSIVENFFVLVQNEKLEITVFGEKISRETLWNVINKYCNQPIEYTNSNIKYGYIKQYLSVYTGIYEMKEFNENVRGAGNLKLLISKGNDINGKWVAMFRNNGMKIFDWNIRTAQQNYSAIFFPGDPEVDKFLKNIENPTHDYFDPDMRIYDKNEKILANKRYQQIQNWIRKVIEEYTSINVSENDYLEGIEEYLQLDDSEVDSNVVDMPEVEIVNYKNRNNYTNPMIESNVSLGEEDVTDFNSKNGKSTKKNNFIVKGTNKFGNDKKGLIKDYHNRFTVGPKITSSEKKIKVAFSLENYNYDKFNIEVSSVGEDNSISDFIPNILEAVNLNDGKKLTVIKNKVIDIPSDSINIISIKFDRKFNARYKINVYREWSEEDEN